MSSGALALLQLFDWNTNRYSRVHACDCLECTACFSVRGVCSISPFWLSERCLERTVLCAVCSSESHVRTAFCGRHIHCLCYVRKIQTLDDSAARNLRTVQVMYRQCDKMTRETGSLCKLLLINDMCGLSWKTFDMRLMRALGQNSKISDVIHPQFTSRNVVVHPPGIIRALFNVRSSTTVLEFHGENRLQQPLEQITTSRDLFQGYRVGYNCESLNQLILIAVTCTRGMHATPCLKRSNLWAGCSTYLSCPGVYCS